MTYVTEMEDGVDTGSKLKGIKKSDLISPKLPLINPSTGKRQDGRATNEIRPVCKSNFTARFCFGNSLFIVNNLLSGTYNLLFFCFSQSCSNWNKGRVKRLSIC